MSTDDKDAAQAALVDGIKLGLYTHYKGGHYIVFARSVHEATLEHLVHYYSIEKKTRWTRTFANFCEKVDHPFYGRFVFIRPASVSELLLACGLPEVIDALDKMVAVHRFLADLQ